MLAAALFLATSSLGAFDWGTLGVKVIKQEPPDEQTGAIVVALEDQAGRAFSVSHVKDLKAEEAGELLKFKDALHAWKIMKIGKLFIQIADQALEAQIVPEKFECKGQEYASYLPAGLLVTKTDALEYNFRIQVKNNFIRIKGLYSDENELCGKLQQAVANPQDYIRRRDPEYVLKKLEELETRLAQMERRNLQLQRAVVTLHNQGFFSGPTAPDQKVIDRVIALKKKDPAMTSAQIAEALKTDGLTASARELSLILLVYFNEK